MAKVTKLLDLGILVFFVFMPGCSGKGATVHFDVCGLKGLALFRVVGDEGDFIDVLRFQKISNHLVVSQVRLKTKKVIGLNGIVSHLL